jgi:hypothetical protein
MVLCKSHVEPHGVRALVELKSSQLKSSQPYEVRSLVELETISSDLELVARELQRGQDRNQLGVAQRAQHRGHCR